MKKFEHPTVANTWNMRGSNSQMLKNATDSKEKGRKKTEKNRSKEKNNGKSNN